ncbi:TPA: iron ABC transporter permease [Methanosarcina acetivorans]|uniref:Cobalamin import system permease protein BtuC n=2 Tax=Methanosarcina acetivorans TaxID=2214 RepID=Q8TRH7_METAC|nr:iron ABC transporter permease [Methanosarcina acetivorans]AAM04620.1 iron ABC transporter, permease protein [Methanosarcina acetivorans C2A]HIH94910.1 iron ABC transporter permease [Methanosarcina acetivorans]
MEFFLRNKKEFELPVLTLLAIVLILTFFISVYIGRYTITPGQLIMAVAGKIANVDYTLPDTADTILFKVRLPRIIAAILIGANLATAGAAYQGMFKNPMVSPDILGASHGAGFGAAVAILLSFGTAGIQMSSLLFGLGAVLLSYTISKIVGHGDNATLTMVLTGMVVSTMFAAFTSMTKYVADTDEKLPAITFWLMGSLASITRKDVLILLIPTVLGMIPLLFLRWKLNVLAFGDEEAQAMGVDTKKVRSIIIFSSTLLVASSVSISGMIGWIGLIVPHIARQFVGPNYKHLLFASMFVGGSFLLIVDDVARNAFSAEIPLGILTALLGAPFFLYLLLKERRKAKWN